MDKTNILYDHYKDTFLIQKENEKSRNKLFLALCICILVLMLMVVYPNNIYENLQEFLLDKLGINIKFELKVLELFNWFIISYLTIRYYQINANIEKNYKYIHNIEDILEKKHKIPIYREGRNYLEQYPIFLTFSYIFYKYVFPILFSICVTTKAIFNIINRLSLPFLIISIVVSIFLIIINISYFTFNYKLRKGGKKNGKA
ncbi:MAG: hypothetical protein MR598_01940 [Erysipelotrichaceae bacterium]|nr:hypothetical protein [Erysipelotrichaceae bacterium]